MKPGSLEYKKKVWGFLERTKPGKLYSVEVLSKPETREAFLEAIKEYMAGLPYNGWISFNSDFSKFYRVPAVPEATKKT